MAPFAQAETEALAAKADATEKRAQELHADAQALAAERLELHARMRRSTLDYETEMESARELVEQAKSRALAVSQVRQRACGVGKQCPVFLVVCGRRRT